MILAPETLEKKDKKKNKSTANYVYVPPTIQLNASPTVLTACAGQPAKVLLDSKVSFSGGSTPRYRWSSDAGHINGAGASTEWDLTGVKPGYYRAFVEVDNGVSEECAVFSSAIVRVNCVPPTCPNITISCPDKVEIDQPLTFCVNTAGGTPGVRPVYEWTVSAGRIVSEEGTNCMRPVDGTKHGLRASALWGKKTKGEARSSALWGKPGRRFAALLSVTAMLVVPWSNRSRGGHGTASVASRRRGGRASRSCISSATSRTSCSSRSRPARPRPLRCTGLAF